MAQLRGITPQIHERGAELVIIGHGGLDQAQWFVETTGLQTPLLLDPKRRSYAAVQAHRGKSSTLHPMGILRAARAWLRGHRQSGAKGDPTQMGATVIVLPDESTPFVHRDAFSGDLPTPDQLLATLDAAAATSPPLQSEAGV